MLNSSARRGASPRKALLQLTASLSALERRSQWAKALQLFFQRCGPPGLGEGRDGDGGSRGHPQGQRRLGRGREEQPRLRSAEGGLKPDAKLLEVVFKSSFRGQSWRGVFALLQELQGPRSSDGRETLLAPAMLALARGLAWQRCLQLFFEAEAACKSAGTSLPEGVLSLTLAMLGENSNLAKRQWRQALHLLHQATRQRQHGSIDLKAANAASLAAARAARWEVALAIVSDTLPAVRLLPDRTTLNTVAMGLESSSKWQHVLRLLAPRPQDRPFSCLSMIEPDVVTVSVALTALAKVAAWYKSLQLLEDCQGARLAPNIVALNAVMTSCGRALRRDRALAVFQQLPQLGLSPTVVSFSAGLAACQKSGSWEMALSLFTEMQASKLHPDALAWNSLIASCGKSSMWEVACHTLQEMDDKALERDPSGLGAALSASADAARWEVCLQLVSRSKILDAVAVSALSAALEEASQMSHLSHFRGSLNSPDLQPGHDEAFKLLREEACRAGRLRPAAPRPRPHSSASSSSSSSSSSSPSPFLDASSHRHESVPSDAAKSFCESLLAGRREGMREEALRDVGLATYLRLARADRAGHIESDDDGDGDGDIESDESDESDYVPDLEEAYGSQGESPLVMIIPKAPMRRYLFVTFSCFLNGPHEEKSWSVRTTRPVFVRKVGRQPS